MASSLYAASNFLGKNMNRKVITDTAQTVIDSVYEALGALSEEKNMGLMLQISLDAPPSEEAGFIKLNLAQILMVDPITDDDPSVKRYPVRHQVPLDRNDAMGYLHHFTVQIRRDLEGEGEQLIIFTDEHQQKGHTQLQCSSFARTYGEEEQVIEHERRNRGWARMRDIRKAGQDIVDFLFHAEFDNATLPTMAAKAK